METNHPWNEKNNQKNIASKSCIVVCTNLFICQYHSVIGCLGLLDRRSFSPSICPSEYLANCYFSNPNQSVLGPKCCIEPKLRIKNLVSGAIFEIWPLSQDSRCSWGWKMINNLTVRPSIFCFYFFAISEYSDFAFPSLMNIA